MPWEYGALVDAPVPLATCPKCGAQPFDPFLRGTVQRSERPWWRPWWGPTRPYCALICWKCKEIVGYESPFVDGT